MYRQIDNHAGANALLLSQLVLALPRLSSTGLQILVTTT